MAKHTVSKVVVDYTHWQTEMASITQLSRNEEETCCCLYNFSSGTEQRERECL